MKAMVIQAFGGAEQLKESQVSKPTPQENEVLVEIAYAGVNPVDWKIREGYFKDFFPHKFPLVLGWEMSGTVREIGKKVKNLSVGNEVYAYCRKPEVQWGAYAEFITLPADTVALKPKNLSHRKAAGIPLAGLTAWQSLFNFSELKSKESVLIHAAAGGVGSYAVQFAKVVGAKVYATASEKNHAYVKKLGADVTIDYETQDFSAVIHDFEPNGVDVILDSIGGEYEPKNFSALKDKGRLVSIVNFQITAPKHQKNAKVQFVFVEPIRKDLESISRLCEEGKVVSPEIHEFPLSQVALAHQQSQKGHVRGKIVLSVSAPNQISGIQKD